MNSKRTIQPPPDTVLLTTLHQAPQPAQANLGLPDGRERVAMGSGTITSLISRGGTALVYEIWNSELEMKRAVKLLHPDHLDESLERFETEIKITAKLRHPNIVEIYAVGKWRDLPYIEMERIDGDTIEEMIRRAGALPIEVCTAIGIMVARALYHAHNHKYMIYGKEYHGIIHRDLKPANIMVDHDGSVKLMDFGIAKPVAASARTMEGVVFGTMQYLSPEQLQSGDVDARSDIYSFGAVLYELVTGRKTFPEQNLAKLVTDKINNDFLPFEDFDVRLPPAFKTLVYSCLNVQKSKRIQSALALEKTLDRIHQKVTNKTPEEVMRAFAANPPRSKAVVRLRKKRGLLALTLGVLSFLVLAGAGGYVYWYVRNTLAKAPLSSPSEPVAAAKTADEEAPAAETTRIPAISALPPLQPREEPAAAAPARPVVRPSPPVAVATPVPVPAAPQQVQHGQRLYSVAEAAQLIESAASSGHYRDALAIYNAIAPAEELTKKLKIEKLHFLQKTGDTRGLADWLVTQDVDDGEFYIQKALYFCRTGELAKARLFYDRSMKSSAEYGDPTAVDESRMYCKALVASAMFDASPTQDTKKEAMDSWYEIKLQYRTSPDNPLFVKADSEIRRINAMTVH